MSYVSSLGLKFDTNTEGETTVTVDSLKGFISAGVVVASLAGLTGQRDPIVIQAFIAGLDSITGGLDED